MPKNDQYQVRRPKEDESKKVHPVWRGIGCISMVIIPILSYVGGVQLVNNRDSLTWIVIPEEIVLKQGNNPLIFVKILYAIIIGLLLFFLLGVITFVVNRLSGGNRKGPYDVD